MNSSYFGGTFMIMRIFKPKAKRIETFNNLGDDEKDRIAKQITSALDVQTSFQEMSGFLFEKKEESWQL